MGAPTGGTWTIEYNGSTTAAIAHSASAADVYSALSAITGTSITVTGTRWPYNQAVFTVRFSGNGGTIGYPASLSAASYLVGGSDVQISADYTVNYAPAVIETAWSCRVSCGGASNGTFSITGPAGTSGDISVSSTDAATIIGYIGSVSWGAVVTQTSGPTDALTSGDMEFQCTTMGYYNGSTGTSNNNTDGSPSFSLIAEYVPGSAEVVAEQTLTLEYTPATDGPTGGTWVITWNGNTTSGISWNANPSDVQVALESLPSLSGKISVEPLSCGPFPELNGGYRLVFSKTLSSPPDPTVTTYLTGGNNVALNVENTQEWIAPGDPSPNILTFDLSGASYGAIITAWTSDAFDTTAADMAAGGWNTYIYGIVAYDGGPLNTAPIHLYTNTGLINVSVTNNTDGTFSYTEEEGAPGEGGQDMICEISLTYDTITSVFQVIVVT